VRGPRTPSSISPAARHGSFQKAEQERPAQSPERERKEAGRERQPEAGQGDPVTRFKRAQKEFIQVAGLADCDPQAKARAAELREEMKRASQEIARDPARMRAAEREGFTPKLKTSCGRPKKKAGRAAREAEKNEGRQQ
jgi:hypothetical protein